MGHFDGLSSSSTSAPLYFVLFFHFEFITFQNHDLNSHHTFKFYIMIREDLDNCGKVDFQSNNHWLQQRLINEIKNSYPISSFEQ